MLAQEFHGYLIVCVITNREDSIRITILSRNLKYCIKIHPYFVPGDFQGEAGSGPGQPDLAVVSLFIAGELD